MSFGKSTTERFPKIFEGYGPPLGTYNPKSPPSQAFKGYTFTQAKRFKEPSVPQEKNALVTQFKNNKLKLAKNRLDILATPCKRVDTENTSNKNKTFSLQRDTKKLFASSPFRERN